MTQRKPGDWLDSTDEELRIRAWRHEMELNGLGEIACVATSICNELSMQWDELREHIEARLRETEGVLAKGKGAWPNSNYIKDAVWEHLQGQAYALRDVIRAMGKVK